MNASFTSPIRRAVRGMVSRGLLGALASTVLPIAALAAGPADDMAAVMDHSQLHASASISPVSISPLVQKVYDHAKKYKNINVALHGTEKGWVVGTPCVSGPETGAMGIHVVNTTRTADGIVDARYPEALIYEPQPDGRFVLVGVEFIQDAADWAYRHPDGPPPSLDGNLMNLVGAPNRYGLKAFYELHVWAFEENPQGAFADWNTSVTCENQPVR